MLSRRSSIPQKNRKIQEGAINSLALYASLADALVIVAPDGRHASNDSIVSKESYQVLRPPLTQSHRFAHS